MSSNNATQNREQAIMALVYDYAMEQAWKIAGLRKNSAEFDSPKNGNYWGQQAKQEENKTRTHIANVGGPHVDFVMQSFDRLVVTHTKTLLSQVKQ